MKIYPDVDIMIFKNPNNTKVLKLETNIRYKHKDKYYTSLFFRTFMFDKTPSFEETIKVVNIFHNEVYLSKHLRLANIKDGKLGLTFKYDGTQSERDRLQELIILNKG